MQLSFEGISTFLKHSSRCTHTLPRVTTANRYLARHEISPKAFLVPGCVAHLSSKEPVLLLSITWSKTQKVRLEILKASLFLASAVDYRHQTCPPIGSR